MVEHLPFKEGVDGSTPSCLNFEEIGDEEATKRGFRMGERMLSGFNVGILTTLAVGGAVVFWERPWYGLFSGTIHGVVAVALNHFFNKQASAIYLAGLAAVS